MVLIKVQYDAYSRHFKLLEGESARPLEDGEIYVVIAEISTKDLESKQTIDATDAVSDLIPVPSS